MGDSNSQDPCTARPQPKEKIMFTKKCFLPRSGVAITMLVLAVRPLYADPSPDSERIEKLERAVEQLQERNAELEQEVRSLKKQVSFAPEFDANGNQKPKAIVSDGKTYVEKDVVTEEKKPVVYITPAGPEYKLALGGYVQMNFEDGAVSAFEGRFPNGPNQVKD